MGHTRTVRKVAAALVAFFLSTTLLILAYAQPVAALTTPTFAAAVQLPPIPNPFAMVVGDFNADGKPDLVTDSNITGVGDVFFGVGNGTFQGPIQFTTSAPSQGMAMADFNGDGKKDIVLAQGDLGRIAILLGIETAGVQNPFGNPILITALAQAVDVAVGDVNGDSKLDIVTANAGQNSATVILGNGNASFSPTGLFQAGLSPRKIILGDFNADGKLDIVTANSGENTVSVLLGVGNGAFGVQTKFGSGGNNPFGLAVDDVNKDGKLDIITTNLNPAVVGVLLGNGNGTFQAARQFQINFQSETVTTGDVNGDGVPDIVAGNTSANSVSVLLGNGDGTFQSAISLTAGPTPLKVIISDINADGKNDVLSANLNGANVSLLLNKTPLADLTVLKSNNVSGSTQTGSSFEWKVLITNSGVGTFTANTSSLIFSDQMPRTSITYGTVTSDFGGGTSGGPLNCPQLNGVVNCTTTSVLNIPVGGTITITIPATVTAAGTYVNPNPPGICKINPAGSDEADSTNNSCNVDTVTVTDPIPQTGTITVTKTLVASEHGHSLNSTNSFGFTISDTSSGNEVDAFSLADGGSSERTLPTGNYALVEEPNNEWEPVGTECFDNNNESVSSESILLAGAAAIVCEVKNRPREGLVTITTVNINDNGGSDTFNDSYVLHRQGSNSDYDMAANTPTYLPWGEYEFTFLTDSDNYEVSTSGDCVQGGNFTLQLSVGAQETKNCTVINDDRAPNLQFLVDVINDEGGTAQAEDFTVSADGPTPFTGVGGSEVGPNFSAGAYTLSINGPEGYSFGTWSCTNASQIDENTFSVALGKFAQCVITANDVQTTGTLTIIKDTTGGDGKFSFSGDGGIGAFDIVTSGGNGSYSLTIPAGIYHIFETVPAGWSNSFSACTNINVVAGQNTTCHVGNTHVYNGQHPLGWSLYAPIPQPVFDMLGVVLNDKIYAVGGQIGDATSTRHTESYDPATDSWDNSLAPAPNAHVQGTAGTINGRIFLASGCSDRACNTPTQRLDIYDIATDSWTTGPSVPRIHVFGSGAVVNDKLYVIGGGTTNANTPQFGVDIFDPVTGQWSTGAPIPGEQHFNGFSVALNGKLYVMGGGPGPTGTFISQVDVYNPVTNSWTTAAPLPQGVKWAGAAVLNGKIHVTSGFGATGFLATHYVYDPATNAWTTAPASKILRTIPVAVSVGNTLYEFGGCSGNCLSGGFDTNWGYTEEQPKPDLSVSTTNDLNGVHATVGVPFHWIYTITNNNPGTIAQFQVFAEVLKAHLPAGATYPINGLVQFAANGGATAQALACGVSMPPQAGPDAGPPGSRNLFCTSSGDVIPFDGSIVVTVEVTPTVSGTLQSPRSGGVCQVDWRDLMTETNETNNDCNTDSVKVDPSTGNLTVHLNVINDSGGTATAAGKTVLVAGPHTNDTLDPGVATPVEPGDYLFLGVSPDEFENYSRSFSGDCDASGTMTVVKGSATSCIVTYDDNSPTTASLTLVKHVINDNLGNALASDFTLRASGPQNISGTSGSAAITNAVVLPGQYTISEDPRVGYTQLEISCVLNNGAAITTTSIDLLPGDTGICTITNDDVAVVDPGNAQIRGATYEDNNANGLRDAGEGSKNGFTVYLDLNGNGVHEANEPQVVSANGGLYSFTGLTAGTYVVRQVPLAGWIITSNASLMITLAPSQNSTGNDFGNAQPGTVKGNLRYANVSGGLKPTGWTVKLIKSSGEVFTTTSDSGGKYNFPNVLPGAYTLAVVVPQGNTQVSGPGPFTVTSKLNFSATDFTFSRP